MKGDQFIPKEYSIPFHIFLNIYCVVGSVVCRAVFDAPLDDR